MMKQMNYSELSVKFESVSQHKLFIEPSGHTMAEKQVFRSTCVWPVEFVEEGQTVLCVTVLSD